ncbi:MAG: ACT domain-containing protein [Acidimicrobiales bacterium]
MARYAVEISLEDQPGALGAVASLIGSLGGDVIDVDVLEHGRGRARDEITLDLLDEEVADQLGRELEALAGVEVEHFAPVGEYGHHLLVDALEVASAMIAETSLPGMFDALVSGILAAFGVSWVVVVAEGRDRPIAAAGGVPPTSVKRASGGSMGLVGSDDCLSLPIGDRGLTAVIGREGWPYRNRERRELTTLMHICATRHQQLSASS